MENIVWSKGYLPIMTKRTTIEVLYGLDFSSYFSIYIVTRIFYLSGTCGIWNCTNCDGLNIFESQFYHVEHLKQVAYHFIDNNRKNSIKQECDSKWLRLDSDTLSKDDSVRKQYLSLPYPAIPEHALRAEYNHYNGRKKRTKVQPYQPVLGIDLERLNHFLFEGKQNFRYQSIGIKKDDCLHG